MSGTHRIQVEVAVDARSAVGEGPIWDHRRQRLIWVDIPRGCIHIFDPASGSTEHELLGQPVGAVGLRQAGGLVTALRDGFAVWEDLKLRWIAHTEAERTGNRMNDGRVDAAGRFWAGTMATDMSSGAGALYRLDEDHQVHQMLGGTTISNGLDWSLDGCHMYYIDSGTGGIDVFDFDQDHGTIRNRARLVSVSERDVLPDGMAVDSDGFLWVALWGGASVRRYAPDGSLVAAVQVPTSQVTSCAFGGVHLDELYITSAANGLTPGQLDAEPHAGAVFACRPGVTGRPANLFGG